MKIIFKNTGWMANADFIKRPNRSFLEKGSAWTIDQPANLKQMTTIGDLIFFIDFLRCLRCLVIKIQNIGVTAGI